MKPLNISGTLWKRRLRRHQVKLDSSCPLGSLAVLLPSAWLCTLQAKGVGHSEVVYASLRADRVLWQRVEPQLPGPNPAPARSSVPRPGQLRLPAAVGPFPPPSRPFPGSATFTGIYWQAQITPVKIIGYAKLRGLDWVSSVWPARCESQSVLQTLRALSPRWLDMIPLDSWGEKLALGSAQRDTNHRWLQWDGAPELQRAPKPGLAKPA